QPGPRFLARSKRGTGLTPARLFSGTRLKVLLNPPGLRWTTKPRGPGRPIQLKGPVRRCPRAVRRDLEDRGGTQHLQGCRAKAVGFQAGIPVGPVVPAITERRGARRPVEEPAELGVKD